MMTVERYLRLIAGLFVIATVALGYGVSPYWFLFTAFVGLNLLQSGFTNWCPMMTILRKLGVRDRNTDRLTQHPTAAHAH
jgi:hypothetical protein